MSEFRSVTRYGSIATPHALATKAGEAAYLAGGSAVDAALAAAAVLTVVYPHNTTIGGDSVSLVRGPDGTTTCINSTGQAPAAASLRELVTRHGEELPVRGPDTMTVPGAVRGWEAIRCLGARLTWEDQLSHAVTHAEKGIPVPGSLARSLASSRDLATDPGLAAVFYPEGEPLAAGAQLVQPALASSLRCVAAGGALAFYGGEVGRKLVAGLRNLGSSLTDEDFKLFMPELTRPLEGRFGELNVLTSPPNTQGFLLLRTFRALFLSGGLTAETLLSGAGDLARSFEQGNAVRDEYLADPRFAELDMSTLLKPVSSSAAGVPLERSNVMTDPRVPKGDTVGISAIDSDGYAVSHIQSIFHLLGSGVLEPSTGILMQNRGTAFSLEPESANRIEPGKRPSHTLMPVMVEKQGALAWVNSTMGGKAQPQVHAQLLLQQLDGATAEEAVSRPRFLVAGLLGEDTPDTVYAEENLPSEALLSFLDAKMPLKTVPPLTESLGHSNVIGVRPDGTFDAASDPRSDGAAAIVELP